MIGPPEPTVPRSNRGWRIGCLSAVRDVARLSRVFTIALQPSPLEREQPDACRPCRRRSAFRFIGVGLWKFYEPCELVWQQRGQCERQHRQFESVLAQHFDDYTRTVGLLAEQQFSRSHRDRRWWGVRYGSAGGTDLREYLPDRGDFHLPLQDSRRNDGQYSRQLGDRTPQNEIANPTLPSDC